MLLKTEILIESLFLAVDSAHSKFSPWWSEMWVGTEAEMGSGRASVRGGASN